MRLDVLACLTAFSVTSGFVPSWPAHAGETGANPYLFDAATARAGTRPPYSNTAAASQYDGIPPNYALPQYAAYLPSKPDPGAPRNAPTVSGDTAPYPQFAQASADPNAELQNLEQRIAEQERRVAEQEQRIKDQAAQLEMQSRERQAQTRLLIDQQEALERQNQELQALRAQQQWYAWYSSQHLQAAPPIAPPVQAYQLPPGYSYAQDTGPQPPVPPNQGAPPPSETGEQPVAPQVLPETQPVAPQAQPEAPTTPQPAQTQPSQPAPTQPVEAQPSKPTQPTEAQPQQPAPPGGEATKTGEEARPESEKPTELLLLEAGGILLPPGRIVLEPSIDYVHTSSNEIAISGFTIFEAIVIGTISVNELNRDIVTAQMTAHAGIADNVQLDAQIPYVYRKDNEVLDFNTPNASERVTSAQDLGDIVTTAEWQPIVGHGSIPDTIFRASVRLPTGTSAFEIPTETVGQGGLTRLTKPPTGTGFYGIGPGVTMVWRTDPVVLFTGGAYTFNLPRSFDRFGEIEPGDTFQFFGGFNFAVNETVSLNMSFIDQITDSTKQNNVLSPGTSTNDARLVLGGSVGISRHLSVLVTAAAGLTTQSPDFDLTISLPITLDVFR